MTNLEMLIQLTGGDSAVLTALLADAEERILVMTGRTHLIDALKPAQRELALINYNRMGSEGMSNRSDSEVGISSSFEDIPATLAAQIYRYRLARVGGKTYEANETEP